MSRSGKFIARLPREPAFGNEKFAAIFIFASITDTTNHDHSSRFHDNVEKFSPHLNFARQPGHEIIYASSASTTRYD